MNVARDILISGLNELGLQLTDVQLMQLLDFVQLIEKWNKAYNLTAIRNQEEMIRLHLLDSLAILPFIEGKHIIDVGTGAGLPGIPLAICLPELAFTLLDSNAKKTRFVQQAVLELGLKNVSICHQRAEAYCPEQKFNQVITRAFANLPDIIKSTKHLLAKKGFISELNVLQVVRRIRPIAMSSSMTTAMGSVNWETWIGDQTSSASRTRIFPDLLNSVKAVIKQHPFNFFYF